jgi:hypothetical protein
VGLGEAPQTCAVTGAHVPLTVEQIDNLSYTCEGGEVKGISLSVPVVLHLPTTFWTVEQVLVFTRSCWRRLYSRGEACQAAR